MDLSGFCDSGGQKGLVVNSSDLAEWNSGGRIKLSLFVDGKLQNE